MRQPPSILVVEDVCEIRRLIEVALSLRGYKVHVASSAKEAMDVLHHGKTDLIILDLMMPEVSGHDVLAMRSDDPSLRLIPTIVVTADPFFDQHDALNFGVFAVLRKPFDPECLQSLVAAGLLLTYGA